MLFCQLSSRSQLQLPDGRIIRVGGERFEAPEVLFQPHLINVERSGLSELLFGVIQSADIGEQNDIILFSSQPLFKREVVVISPSGFFFNHISNGFTITVTSIVAD